MGDTFPPLPPYCFSMFESLSKADLATYVRGLSKLGVERYHVARRILEEGITGHIFCTLSQIEISSLCLSKSTAHALKYIQEDESSGLRDDEEIDTPDDILLEGGDPYESISDPDLLARLEIADRMAEDRGIGAIYGTLVSIGYTHYRWIGTSFEPVGRPNTSFPLRRRSANATKWRSCTRTSNFYSLDNMLLCTTRDAPLGVEWDEYQFGRSIATNDFCLRGATKIDLQGKVRGCISRHACRIICQRLPPYKVIVKAGGYDENGVLNCISDGVMSTGDGFSKHSIRLWNPTDGLWYAVTARGHLLCAESSSSMSDRSEDSESEHCSDTSSLMDGIAELYDGAILDIQGCALVFRSPRQAFLTSPSSMVQRLSELNTQCPVHLHTIQFEYTPYFRRCQESVARLLRSESRGWSTSGALTVSDTSDKAIADSARRAYVFPSCGHVVGYSPTFSVSGKCPLCRQIGPYVALSFPFQTLICGLPPTHVFNPCGHAAHLLTCQFFSTLKLPNQKSYGSDFVYQCPFCSTVLAEEIPFSRLILQSEASIEEAVGLLARY